MNDIIDEFQKRYGNNIRIIEGFPSKEELKSKPSFLQNISNAAGVPSYLWKGTAGTLIGVIFIVPALDDAYTYWQPKVISTYENSMQYVDYIRQTSPRLSDEFIGFLKVPSDLQNNMGDYSIIAPQMMKPNFSKSPSRFSGSLWRIINNAYAINYDLNTELDFYLNRRYQVSSRFSDGTFPIYYLADDLLTALEHFRFHYRAQVISSGQNFNEVEMLRKLTAVELQVSGSTEIVPSSFFSEPKHVNDFTETQEFGKRWIKEGRSDILVSPSLRNKDSLVYMCNLKNMKNNIKFRGLTHLTA